MKSKAIFIAGLIMLCAGILTAAEYYVSRSGSDQAGDGSKQNPWRTVSFAASAVTGSSTDAARINVASGTYSETQSVELGEYEEIIGGFRESDWTRPGVGYDTTIDGSSLSSNDPIVRTSGNSGIDYVDFQNASIGVVCNDASPTINECEFENMSTSAIWVEGENASPSVFSCVIENVKEGVYVYGGNAPVIEDCVIKNNSGNGIAAQNCAIVISKNEIRDNGASGVSGTNLTGGSIMKNVILDNKFSGIFLVGGEPLVANNVSAFHQNAAGIYCRDGSNPRLYHNTLYLNGSGITCRYYSSPEIINNISYKNEDYGIYEGLLDCAPVLQNNCLYGNVRGNYLDGATTPAWTTQEINAVDNGGALTSGNLAEDPLINDAHRRDFHIFPASPCIGAALHLPEITIDYEGDSRTESGSGSDIGADEYVSSYAYGFDAGDEGWTFNWIPGFATEPGHAAQDGGLQLTAADSNTYGVWDGPPGEITVFENEIYRGRWRVSTDEEDQSKVPGFRARFNEADQQTAGSLLVYSKMEGGFSPTPSGDTYELYFCPVQGGALKMDKASELLCSFEMINFDDGDNPSASVKLEDFQLAWAPVSDFSEDFQLEKVFDFTDDEEGWTFAYSPDFADPPQESHGPSFLSLRATGSNTFGWWQSSAQSVTPGRLYRARIWLKTDVTPRSMVPMIRFRANMLNNQGGWLYQIYSNTDGDSSPTPGEFTMYEMYFVPPPSVESLGLIYALDLVNLEGRDQADGAVFLDKVEVHSAALPLF